MHEDLKICCDIRTDSLSIDKLIFYVPPLSQKCMDEMFMKTILDPWQEGSFYILVNVFLNDNKKTF